MKKILMVCLGNICRSPLAAGILEKKLQEKNKTARVDSAGFESFHEGDPADSRTISTAARHGINLKNHRARLFNVTDFDNYDQIYVMDQNNFRDVMSVARNEEDRKKVRYILEVLPDQPQRYVPDPYYGGIDGFEKVYQLLDQACEKISDNIS